MEGPPATFWTHRVLFDLRYGIDTSGIIYPAELGVPGDHWSNANRYEAVPVSSFKEIMKRLRIRHSNFVFVDFGSGKGRAVFLAAHYPFKKVVGVELFRPLHETAMANLTQFQRRSRHAAPVELICQDAAGFSIPQDPLVCFLYNPFDEVVLRLVIGNLAESYSRQPRKMFVAYRIPKFTEVLDQAPFLRLLSDNRTFRIYESVRDA